MNNYFSNWKIKLGDSATPLHCTDLLDVGLQALNHQLPCLFSETGCYWTVTSLFARQWSSMDYNNTKFANFLQMPLHKSGLKSWVYDAKKLKELTVFLAVIFISLYRNVFIYKFQFLKPVLFWSTRQAFHLHWCSNGLHLLFSNINFKTLEYSILARETELNRWLYVARQ